MDERGNVALYARVSSQRQAEELTIRSQVAALRGRIAQDGLLLEEALCFLDEGYSGATLQRPALERLRDVAYCGGIDRLYVHSPDRLARKYAYQFLLLEELKKHGVEVVFLNHDPQDRSPEGDLLLQMQGMIAEYERAKILERTRRGRRFAARQGKVSAVAHAPYGYRYVPKREGDGEARYDVVLDEARVVKEMFTWVGIEGLSLGGVVGRLAERSVRTSKGQARWDRATVRGILQHSAYTGTARYPKTRRFPRKSWRRAKRGDSPVPRQAKVCRATSPEEQEPIPVPAIVSQELFDAVAERLAENRRRQRQREKGAEFLLSGLLVCHRCGSAYCGRRSGGARTRTRYIYYRCIGTDKYRHGGEAICANASVNGAQLEQAVWRDVCELLQDPGRVQRELERRLQQSSTGKPDGAHLQASIGQLKRRVGRLIDAYENGWLDKSDFEQRMARVKERLKHEEEAWAEQQREACNGTELRLMIGQFQSFAEQIADGLEEADFATRRKILRVLIHRIEVDAEEVRILYRVQPHPFVLTLASDASGENLQHCLSCPGIPPG
jgi:site-specific DNA recombinase